MKTKFPSVVYASLKLAGLSNREIARQLGVSEASVRRGLANVDAEPTQPKTRRQFLVTVEEV